MNAQVQSQRHQRLAASRRVGDYVAESSVRLGGSNYSTMCDLASRSIHRSDVCSACRGLGFTAVTDASLAKLRADIQKLRDGAPDPSEARSYGDEIRASNAVQRRRQDEREVRRRMQRDSICARCDGTGYVRAKETAFIRPDSMWTMIRCSRCRGGAPGQRLDPHVGEISVGTANTRHTVAIVDALLGALGFDERCDTCERCGGELGVVAITVRPTGSTRKGRLPKGATDAGETTVAAVEPNVEELIDLAREFQRGDGSALLGLLEQEEPTASRVLRAYYGTAGDRFAASPRGRRFVLWPMTTAGKRLLDAALDGLRAGRRALADPLIMLERACAGATRDDVRRRALMASADRDARVLLVQAELAAERLAS